MKTFLKMCICGSIHMVKFPIGARSQGYQNPKTPGYQYHLVLAVQFYSRPNVLGIVWVNL